MRRLPLECVVVAGVAGALALGWFGFPEGGAVCGADGTLFAWRVAHLQAAWEGRAALGLDGGVTVPLAGWPWSAAAVLLAGVAGLASAWQLTVALAVGAGGAALWGVARAGGAGLLAAGLATLVGTVPVTVARGLGMGGVDLAVVPFAVLALGLLPRSSPAAKLVGGLAVLACAACDARTGAILGLAAAVAGGGGWALFAALVATGMGVSAGAAAGVLDPVDLFAPALTLRDGALLPGLAALAGALWVVGDSGLRRAAAVGFVCALGPVLTAFGDPLVVGGAAVPLPAAALAAFVPSGEGWAGALVVAAVAVALGLGRLERPRWALLLAPLALAEAWSAAGAPPECLSLDTPVALRSLAEREGGVLDLPVVAELNGVRVGGPAGAPGLYLYQRTLHGRPLATGLAPLGATHPLYGEPGVVLALGAVEGLDRWLLPPTRPGEVLRGLGVTEIVVHRSLFPARSLALMDPVLYKLYGAPQRDHAGNVDLYRVPVTGTRAPTAEALHASDGPPVEGWTTLAAYLAGSSGAVGGTGGAPGAVVGAGGAPGAVVGAGGAPGAGEKAPEAENPRRPPGERGPGAPGAGERRRAAPRDDRGDPAPR